MRLLLFGISSCFWLFTSAQTTIYVPTAPCVGVGCSMTTEPPTGIYSTTTESSTSLQRTEVFVQTETKDGEDVFIRGGISNTVRPGCVGAPNAETDPCAISIQVNL